MAWIESHQELGQHPKLKKLCRLLDISQPAAVGHLMYLWWWAVDYCDNGDLTRFEPLDIAVAAQWEGDPETFLEALIRCGWVDRQLDEMLIHDWDEYIGRLLDRRRKDADRKRASRGRPQDVQRTVRGHPKDGAQTAHVTKPNQTVPNQGDPPLVPPKGGAKPRRKSRLPAEWLPSPEDVAYAKAQGFGEAEIHRQAELFRDHWLANGETKDDWHATWRNWIRRAPDFERTRSNVVAINGRTRSDPPDFAQMVRDMESQESLDPWNS